jgi:hypothetical protein
MAMTAAPIAPATPKLAMLAEAALPVEELPLAPVVVEPPEEEDPVLEDLL